MKIVGRYWFRMIEPISLSQLAVATEGQVVGEDVYFSTIATDTRTLKEGDLYVALKGERFDGHQFLEQASQKGCSSFLIDAEFNLSEKKLQKVPHVIVNNTLRALGQCAHLNRQNFKGKIVGLTGSSGKTSTKNMLECILSEKGATYATQGNFNNEIGVPLTLLNINGTHEYAVIEMGARRRGDIEYLVDFVQPDVAVLLNAGTSHIDVFGSQENIVIGKGEIFSSLKSDGLAVVNADDPAKQVWLDSLQGKNVLTFSLSDSEANVFASDIKLGHLSSDFILNYQGESKEIVLPAPGLHNIANGLAASAAAIHLGISLSAIARGFSKLNASQGRLMTVPCSENLVIIDDSYNANPSSMRAAIDVLSLKHGFKVAILGEMAELGDFSKKLHLELAIYLSQSNVDKVYLICPYATEMSEKIGKRATVCKTKKAIFDSLSENERIFENDRHELVMTNVLIKGSRSTAMDELVDMIIKKAAH